MPSEKQIEAAIKAAINAVWTGSDGDNAQYCMMKAALTAAAQAQEAQPVAKVKALEWVKLSTGWISHTSFHAYEVVATANGFMATYANLDFAWGEEETMKLAAQADYEQRILSALSLTPTSALAAVRDEVLEEAAKIADEFTNSDWIAYDMKSGEFPKQSKPGHAIAAAIRARKETGE